MDSNSMKTFTIVDTETQRTKEIQSNATIVADLKRDLRQAGFNVDGKTIQEALTRTEFKDDASVLPHDVPYKGGITNDLVFRLTKANKQVRSGMDRQQAYAEVKKMNLGNAIKAKFGKNFTQCSTNDLVSFINAHKGTAPCNQPNGCAAPAPKAKESNNSECSCIDIIKNLCSVLIDNGTIDETDMEAIFGEETQVNNVPKAANGSAPRYSKDELSALLGGL